MEQKQRPPGRAKKVILRLSNLAQYRLDQMLAGRVNPAETVIITGFKRSGTTWLQQTLARILNAKTVFEPLALANPEVPKMYRTWPIAHRGWLMLHTYMPFWATDGQTNGPPPHNNFPVHFEKALTANLRADWSRKVRQGGTLLQTRVMLKSTLSHLCIRAIHNHFGCPVIHLTRDPRGVLASVKTVGWDEVFNKLCLQHQLLDQPDGRAEFFNRWRALILDYDQRDKFSKIIAYWALSENAVRHSFVDQPAQMIRVTYEDLVRQPGLFHKILDAIQVSYSGKEELGFVREDSHTTASHRHGISPEERIFGWRNMLTTAEIAMVNQAAADFDLTDTLVDD